MTKAAAPRCCVPVKRQAAFIEPIFARSAAVSSPLSTLAGAGEMFGRLEDVGNLERIEAGGIPLPFYCLGSVSMASA
jgi:hypothetical protein